jgi:transcriptional regulator with XRE-family HTH domain
VSTVPMAERQAVGAYVRQQRQRARPDAFPALTRRRRHVVHLSQGDLAELAGVSVSLIEQVENGRYDNLNPGLVLRLALALGLSLDEQQYLLNYLLPVRFHLNGQQDQVPAAVRSLVDATDPNPAVVADARFDILYWNRGATRMIADFGALPREQRNVLVSMFCVPEMRTAWDDWEGNARLMTAGLRMQGSLHPHYREAIHELAAFLADSDPQFREWWASEEPATRPNPEKVLYHPEFGRLRLYQTVSEVMGHTHLSLIVYTPRDEETARRFREF